MLFVLHRMVAWQRIVCASSYLEDAKIISGRRQLERLLALVAAEDITLASLTRMFGRACGLAEALVHLACLAAVLVNICACLLQHQAESLGCIADICTCRCPHHCLSGVCELISHHDCIVHVRLVSVLIVVHVVCLSNTFHIMRTSVHYCVLHWTADGLAPLKLLGQDRLPAMVHPASSTATFTLVRTALRAYSCGVCMSSVTS
jgi:hypothetical protein